MNAATIINDSMTLEEKLEAIDNEIAKRQNGMSLSEVGEMMIAPVDPASLLICEGCQ
jgi:hypothetical protein